MDTTVGYYYSPSLSTDKLQAPASAMSEALTLLPIAELSLAHLQLNLKSATKLLILQLSKHQDPPPLILIQLRDLSNPKYKYSLSAPTKRQKSKQEAHKTKQRKETKQEACNHR